ncbi:MAG TPA: hypothetical protein VG936_14990 [Lacunisphaera sp.]|nr:hypothetical protein [Lacunisphaera sp.]
MTQPWKVVLVLIGIFLAGAVTGGLVVARFGRELIAHRPMPDQWAAVQLRRLAERLDLTPQQQEELKPIIRRNMEELRKLRNYAMSESRTVFERMQREIGEKLSPEQRAKYEQMQNDFRDRARRVFPDRPWRGPGGPGGPRPDREHPGRPGDEKPNDQPSPEKPADKPPGI